jgi:peptide-methionine (S)-S-oxide reductase
MTLSARLAPMRLAGAAAALALMFGACGLNLASAADLNKPIPAAIIDAAKAKAATSETLVLAGGCFWGQQGVFQHVKGVTKVVAGYSGGTKETATYPQVTTEKTGHAEAVEITFDPRVVSAGDLLRIFFSVAHDPTQLNRQGPDFGPSYRSEIFYATPKQQEIATAYIKQLGEAKLFSGPIVTKVEALKAFYPAEDYHQDFLIHNPTHGYIVVNDLPKVANFKRVWPDLYVEKPVMITKMGS